MILLDSSSSFSSPLAMRIVFLSLHIRLSTSTTNLLPCPMLQSPAPLALIMILYMKWANQDSAQDNWCIARRIGCQNYPDNMLLCRWFELEWKSSANDIESTAPCRHFSFNFSKNRHTFNVRGWRRQGVGALLVFEPSGVMGSSTPWAGPVVATEISS